MQNSAPLIQLQGIDYFNDVSIFADVFSDVELRHKSQFWL